MSKKTKKRNKSYQGTDAKIQTPVIHRYAAVVRSPFAEWWHEHQRRIKIIALISGVALLVGWLLLELLFLIFTGHAL